MEKIQAFAIMSSTSVNASESKLQPNDAKNEENNFSLVLKFVFVGVLVIFLMLSLACFIWYVSFQRKEISSGNFLIGQIKYTNNIDNEIEFECSAFVENGE